MTVPQHVNFCRDELAPKRVARLLRVVASSGVITLAIGGLAVWLLVSEAASQRGLLGELQEEAAQTRAEVAILNNQDDDFAGDSDENPRAVLAAERRHLLDAWPASEVFRALSSAKREAPQAWLSHFRIDTATRSLVLQGIAVDRSAALRFVGHTGRALGLHPQQVRLQRDQRQHRFETRLAPAAVPGEEK